MGLVRVSMIQKVVIPAAGLGTRLLPVTKEMPKEMLPIFSRGKDGRLCLKPMLQAVFEQLFDVGFTEYCFVVGRGKRAIEDHFASDKNFLEVLRRKNKGEFADELEVFYQKVNDSSIVFMNQPEPKGFGDAVLKATSFVMEDFLVHAGDTYIISPRHQHLTSLLRIHEEVEADATFLVKEIPDPRQHGVMEGKLKERNIYEVERVVEKPKKPSTNLAIMPVYLFKPVIFNALEDTQPGKSGEIQLTDGIQKLIDWELRVVAVKLEEAYVRLDIGNPESCWEAFRLSHEGHSQRPSKEK